MTAYENFGWKLYFDGKVKQFVTAVSSVPIILNERLSIYSPTGMS